MTTATPPVAHAGLDFLGKAALVLLTFQAGGLAHMMVVRGLDRPPNGYLHLVMLAALFAGTQRRPALLPSTLHTSACGGTVRTVQ